MIDVVVLGVVGFENAVHAMRNPMNSWEKDDSQNVDGNFSIGQQNLQLMQRLYNAGTEHRTYARMIYVTMDIVAPLYWWKEMDRYTVGKSQVSCSTMHKIAAKEFELNDFSWEQLLNTGCDLIEYTWQNGLFKKMVQPLQLLTDFIIPSLNVCREKYLETKDKKYWWQLIQLLPSSYNQKRTVCMSYEVVFKIIKERTGHKLDEWNEFVKILKNLPYVEDIINGTEAG